MEAKTIMWIIAGSIILICIVLAIFQSIKRKKPEEKTQEKESDQDQKKYNYSDYFFQFLWWGLAVIGVLLFFGTCNEGCNVVREWGTTYKEVGWVEVYRGYVGQDPTYVPIKGKWQIDSDGKVYVQIPKPKKEYEIFLYPGHGAKNDFSLAAENWNGKARIGFSSAEESGRSVHVVISVKKVEYRKK